ITIVTIKFRKKPGTISYKSKMPPERQSPQIITVVAPTIIPHNAPSLVIPRQQRDKTIIGPKEAPKPAQSSLTRSSTLLSGFVAMIPAISAMATVAILPTHTNSLSEAFFLKNPLTRNWCGLVELLLSPLDLLLES